MSRDIAPYVSAVSAMLAAYAFFFNAFKQQIDDAAEVGDPDVNLTPWKRQLAKAKKGVRTATWLAAVPFLIWVLFLDKTEDGIAKSTWDLGRYETLDVLFFVLANGWLLIGMVMSKRALALKGKVKELEGAKPTAG